MACLSTSFFLEDHTQTPAFFAYSGGSHNVYSDILLSPSSETSFRHARAHVTAMRPDSMFLTGGGLAHLFNSRAVQISVLVGQVPFSG